MRPRSGEGLRFLHECPEWDNMLVCENDPEFASCPCDFLRNNEEAQAAREALQEDL